MPTDPTQADEGDRPRRRRPSLLALALVVVLLAGAGAFLWSRGPDPPPGWPDPGDDVTTAGPPASPSPTPTATPAATPTATPEPSVRVEVGDDLQTVVDAHPAGTTYVLAAGVHRLQSVRPQDGDRFVGESGAVLSGAKELAAADFARTGELWVLGGQTQQATTSGRWGCGEFWDHYYAECGHEQEVHAAEELFADGERLRHVNGRDEVAEPGTWFFDYERDEIVMYDDPGAFALLETSVVEHAFDGEGVDDVTIENLVVRHYANRAQRGAINAYEGRGWTLAHVEASDNHGAGIYVGPGAHVTNARVTGNGQIGILAGGMNDQGEAAAIVVEDSEIAHNHALGFQPHWEAGATKFARTTDMVFRNNWVHGHPRGNGVWFDIDNVDAVIHSNLIEHNAGVGLLYEISYGADIYWNVVRHNHDGTGTAGTGIMVTDSPDVHVHENAIYGNHSEVQGSHQNRREGLHGLGAVRNLVVERNDIGLSGPGVGVTRCCGAETDPWQPGEGNRFDANTYRLPDPDYAYWWWDGRARARDEWQAFGQDGASTFLPAEETPRLPPDATPFAPAHYGPR